MGGASSKDSRFQRQIAWTVLPGPRRKRRNDVMAITTNHGDTKSRSFKFLSVAVTQWLVVSIHPSQFL